jgi:uncharacterized protein YndB with AHSA1/START domain
MEKTGESYTSARAALLSASEPEVEFTVSDEVITRRTGRGWEEWLGILDEWGGTDRSHAEIARWLREEQGVDGWSSQSVTVSYERARGIRAVGETTSGFVASVSKTVAVPVERLYDAWTDPELRRQWLPDAELSERTANRPRGARFDWGDGRTRVVAGFESKGEAKSMVGMSHEKLADAEEKEQMRAFWRERLSALKELLES